MWDDHDAEADLERDAPIELEAALKGKMVSLRPHQTMTQRIH